MKENYKHVAVIGIDGMGNFNRIAKTPFMDEIFENAAVTYNALSMAPTISAQNWGAMLLGANPAVHGLTNGIVSHKKYENKNLPSVFLRIKQVMPKAKTASFCNWNPINYGIIEDEIGVKKDTNSDDNELCDMICRYLSEEIPTFLFVQFDDTDGAGHKYGYGNEKHLEKISETDILVENIYKEYEKAGVINDTLFVVIADHGGIRVGHGGYTDSEKYIFLGVSGKSVKKNEIKFAYTKDIASIVLYALGIEIPGYNTEGFTSQVPLGIFEDITDYYIPEIENLPIVSKPTPNPTDKDGLFSYINKDKLMLGVFFDESMEDVTRKNTHFIRGNMKYYNGGVCGSFAEVGLTGNACYKDVKVANNSFSLAFWAKIDHSFDGCPAVCGNKDWFWKNSSGIGFIFSFRNSDTMLNISDGKGNCDEIIAPFPENISEGWIHTIAVLDKEKKEYRCYYNFRRSFSMKMEDNMIFDLDSSVFALGDDAPGTYNSKENNSLICLDDFLMFNEALNETDIESLKMYYGY